jgi:ParB family transcriptional regulator, chromosome partitioning protein
MFKGMRDIDRCRGNLLREAAALYKVDFDAVALEVKREIAAKDKAKAAKKQPAKATAAKSKKAA